MKTKLFRKNVCLGVLLAFVLALGVQSTADAITKFTKTSSTDYQVRSINEPFTITFSISTQSQSSIKDSDGRLVAEDGSTHIDSSGYPGTWGDHDSNSNTPDTFKRTAGASAISTSLRYHYNDEAIGISATRNGTDLSSDSSTLTLRRSGTSIPLVGATRVSGIPNDTSASLYERAESSNRRLSGSLTGVATTHGVYKITIHDITSTDDTPDGYTVATSVTFTIYVWRNVSSSLGTSITTRLSNDIAEQFGTVPLSVVLSGEGSDYAKVEFEVTRGPGRLYEDKNGDGKADKSASSKLTTFTNNKGNDDGNANTAHVILKPNRGTTHVRAWVSGNTPGTTGKTTKAIYSYRYAQLKKVSGDNQTAPANSRVEDPFVFQLVDSTGSTTIPGADITFTIAGDGSLRKDPSFPDDLYHDNFLADNPTLQVETDSNGKVSVFLVLGASGTQSVTASFGASSATFNASIGTATTRTPQTIEIMPGTDEQKANQYGVLEKALAVIVRDQYGDRLPNATVEFEARDGGTLSDPATGDPGTPTEGSADNTDRRRDINTNNSGEASVRYLAADGSGAQKVTATLEDGSRRFKTFTINGKTSTTPPATTPTTSPTTVTPSLIITTTGEGTTRSVTVTARNAQNAVVPGIGATLSGTALTTSQIVITGTPVSITLPTPPGTYTLQAVAGGYTTANINVTVVAPPEPGRLSIGLVGTQVNGQQTIEVTARDSDGTAPSGALTVSLSGAGISRTVTITNGSGRGIIALPATPATLTASATGYTSGTLTLPARTTTTTTTTTPTTTTPTTPAPGGTAESIEIDGNRQISGTLAVATPLRVRVLDANDAGVSEVGVVFRVLAPGRGTFAGARGSGRAIRLETDRNGTARANFTPTTEGDIIVEAKAAGVTAPVTFIIDVGETSTPTTPATSPNTGETPEPSRTIDPEVLMGAAQRPPMLWVDGGSLYALVGADVQEFAIGVENVQNLAVSGNKVYYTEKTGENAGTINAMNLDGTGAKQLVSIKAVPKGIAVDPVGKRLYWTNSHGWIQSSNLQGTARRNVAKGLSNPMGIAVAAGKTVYWTEEGPSSPELLNGHTGQSVPGVSVAISGNTLYWTQRTGENAGTIHSVNLNGTGAKHLVSIKAVPMGITVDSVGKRLYWTNSHGWIQSSNLQGTARRNVAKGLGSPGGIALSANIKAPATTPLTTSTPVSSGGSKYDVNGDGTVDSKDVDAVLLAVSAGLTLAKYDVNGDKNVDIKDIMAVNANLTAGAPTLLGTKFTAIEIDRLQAQIDLLIATGDRSPAALKTLIYLQQLIAMARPEKTQLLANYPNPFNPETWIPYELATDTDVRITIYNAQGVVIRTLQLGQQSAGYYTDRERAAYWDGRNALGEQVASGIYFYQLETDAMSSLRKMVILK